MLDEWFALKSTVEAGTSDLFVIRGDPPAKSQPSSRLCLQGRKRGTHLWTFAQNASYSDP